MWIGGCRTLRATTHVPSGGMDDDEVARKPTRYDRFADWSEDVHLTGWIVFGAIATFALFGGLEWLTAP